MPFNKIVLNFGGAWDTLTNMFIAPVKGMYAFHLTIQKTEVTDNDLTVHIMHEFDIISGAHVNSATSGGTGSSTALIELDLLSRVYAQVYHGPIQSTSWYGVGSVQFTGFLLYILS